MYQLGPLGFRRSLVMLGDILLSDCQNMPNIAEIGGNTRADRGRLAFPAPGN